MLGVACVIVAGCGPSRVTQVEVGDYVAAHSVRTLGIASSGDLVATVTNTTTNVLADAIGAEMAKRGYSVVDSRAATEMLAKRNINAVDWLTPQGLAVLKESGVDALLSVSSTGSSVCCQGGAQMRYVKVTLTNTSTSKMIGEINWNNSWAGMPGSIDDWIMRKGPAKAAPEIAKAVAEMLESSGGAGPAVLSN